MNEQSRALVPLAHEQQAALKAIAETEDRRDRGKRLADCPYAVAFFRYLNGSSRPSLTDFRFFSPVLTAEELRGSRSQWLSAVDMLIESQGDVCLLPLPGDAAERLFPAVRFRAGERQRQRVALDDHKYSRQRERERVSRESAYQALAGQAEIELAFQTPDTVSAWYERQACRNLQEWDMAEMLWGWIARRPSLAMMARDEWYDSPLWAVVAEIGRQARQRSVSHRLLDRWLVPDKLPYGASAEVMTGGQHA